MKRFNLPPLTVLGLALVLCACPNKPGNESDTGEVSDTGDTDTEDTDTQEPDFPTGEFSEEDARTAIASVELPNLVFLMSSMLISFGDELSCPAVQLDEPNLTTTLTGGCTTEEGTTFSGQAQFVYTQSGLTITYTAFGWSDENGGISVDSVAIMDESEVLVTNGWFGIDQVEENLQFEVQFTDYSLSSPEHYISTLFEQNGSYTNSGQMVVSGMDRFDIELTAGNAGTCDSELDTFELKLTGTRGEIAATTNVSDCDACMDWSTSSASGQFCRDEEEPDTGTN
jgi:hypothetical protein